MIDFAEAFRLVQRFGRMICRSHVWVKSFEELDTHWLINYVVPSSDQRLVFRTGKVIVEKDTGHLYYDVPRVTRPSDWGRFPGNPQAFQRVTQSDLEEMEKE